MNDLEERPFDLQMFAEGDEDEILDDELEEEEEEEEEDDDISQLPIEEQNAKLRERLKAQKKETKGVRSELNELGETVKELKRAGVTPAPAPAPTPEKKPLTQEERDQRNAKLLLEFNEDPDAFLEKRDQETANRILALVNQRVAPGDDAAADKIIDRYVKKWKKENPVIADGVEAIFYEDIESLNAGAKARLLAMPEADRNKALEFQMDAAAGKFLKSRVKVKQKRSPSTPNGGGGVESRSSRGDGGGTKFTAEQKAAMKKRGISDARIAEMEKGMVAS